MCCKMCLNSTILAIHRAAIRRRAATRKGLKALKNMDIIGFLPGRMGLGSLADTSSAKQPPESAQNNGNSLFRAAECVTFCDANLAGGSL